MSRAAVSTDARWLSGPSADLLFGCGLIYLFAFAALAADGAAVRAAFPLSVTPFLVLLTGVPHYGATLLRVYEHAADRRRYAFFGVFATLAVAAAFGVGLYEVTVGSWLLTIYLTWSPWHYSGQNYGIALMFLRRRGVDVSPTAKRLLHASFVLSFLLTAVMMHAVEPDVTYAPNQYENTVYRLVPLELPASVVGVVIPALAALYLGAVAGAGWLLSRAGSVRDLVPTGALVASQALWFAVPALARKTDVLQGVEPLGTDHATYAFLWVAAAHAVQYLWITHYYARASGDSSLAWAGKALAAGAAIWMVPALVFAPGVLGRFPFDAGLGLLIASAVNIHHFILDGAIWKLRDGPIARILLRPRASVPDAVGEPREGTPRLAMGVWGVGAVAAGLWCFGTYERAFGLEDALAQGDVERVEAAHRRLGWIGQESARVHVALATLYQEQGDDERAAAAAHDALELQPGADTLFDLSTLHHRARRAEDAIDAAERALELRPESPVFRNRVAWLLVSYRPDDPAAVGRAREIQARLVEETGGRNASYLHTLAMTQAAQGDFGRAVETADAALAVAEAEGQEQLAELIRVYREQYAIAAAR